MRSRNLWSRIVISVVFSLFLMLSSSTNAMEFLMDGGTHTIDANGLDSNGVTITGQLYIMSNTTVYFNEGAQVLRSTPADTDGHIHADSMQLDINGGSIDGILYVYPNCTVTVSGSDFAIDGGALDPSVT